MNLKRTVAVSISTAALLLGGAGVSHASDGPKFQTNSQILPCANLELVNLVLLGSDVNNQDCSFNYKEEYHYESYRFEHDRDRDRDRDRDHGRNHRDDDRNHKDDDRDHKSYKNYDKDYDEDYEDKDDKDHDKY